MLTEAKKTGKTEFFAKGCAGPAVFTRIGKLAGLANRIRLGIGSNVALDVLLTTKNGSENWLRFQCYQYRSSTMLPGDLLRCFFIALCSNASSIESSMAGLPQR